jgi:anti-sigma B factor antagonist
MQIDHEQLDGRVLKINLSGRMDAAGSTEIQDRLAVLTASPANAVIVDLSKVEIITSVGIRTLLLNAKALTSRGGRMVLLNPGASVTKVLAISGIDRVVGMFCDLEAARANLSSNPSTDA